LIDLDALGELIDETTALVTVCLVNNETGVIQDVKAISEICEAKGALLHLDATQAFGKVPIDVSTLGADFFSASGHKIYGPKGIGILFFKRRHSGLLAVSGANNEVEFGVRSGTVPVHLCVGLGKAAEMAGQEMQTTSERISRLRNKLEHRLKEELDEVYVNGSKESNYPGILNMSFRGAEGEALMMEAKRIAISSGSACTSNKLTISHVLDAMGISPDIAQSSLRISIGKYTTEEDIDIAAEDLIHATTKLRKISPVWDMIQEGVDLDSAFKTVFERG
jgi:cysteine desulfurase